MSERHLTPKWFIQLMAFSAIAAFIIPFLVMFLSVIRDQLDTPKKSLPRTNINIRPLLGNQFLSQLLYPEMKQFKLNYLI